MLSDGPQEAGSIFDCGNDLAVDFGQQPDETLAKQHRVIGHNDTHRHQAVTPGA